MARTLSHLYSRLPIPLRRLIRPLVIHLQPLIFQTEAGIKYRMRGFDSSRFDEFVIQEISLSAAGVSFSELLLPPDYLRNKYTHCGRSIIDSPHYNFARHYLANSLTPEIDYCVQARLGILDSRLSHNPSLEFLTQCLDEKREALFGENLFCVYVMKAIRENRADYVIFDGKHRAAFAAAYDKPKSILLREISKKAIQDPFFQRIYAYTLKMAPSEFSINQEMIRVLLGES